MSERGRPVLLFATIAAGGGHVATARAMSEAVERYYPGQFGLRVSDYMKDVGIIGLDQGHKNVWNRVSRYPILARGGQRIIDAFPRLTIAVQRRILSDFARVAAADLDKAPPLLVVSNHGLITTGLAVSKRRYGFEVPVLTFATEPHNISAYWADPQADHIVVPSEEVRRDLLRLGVPASKMSIVSYPVRQAFLNAPSKAEARARLGLEHRFTCLVSLGGEGVGGNPRRLVRALLEADLPLQAIVITGRNRALRSKLQGLRPGSNRLKIEGFVDDVAVYLAASDVVVGKAGPASVYEALAVRRPVLVTSYVGLNERAVARFVERQGLGYHVRNPEALLEIVRRYASNPTLLEEVALRCRWLGLEDRTERLAHYIVRYARAGTTR
jgi:UDP-N-acetylglucosamine:LPS N-acetylglucosamine transferase